MGTSSTTKPICPNDLDFRLNEDAAQPLYQQVQSLIREHIAEGRLQPGHRLPPVMQLSEEMGIAYATVARGVHGLVEEGILEANKSRGTVVAPPISRRTHHTGIFGSQPVASLLTDTRYYRALLFLIQEALVERGQTVVYNRWGKQDTLPELLDKVHSIDSTVLFQVDPARLGQVKNVLQRGMPLICVGDTFHDPDVPSVQTTNRHDAARLVRLLRARGNSRIAALDLCGRVVDFTADQRLLGFTESMQDLDPSCQTILRGPISDMAAQLLSLPKPPTAVILITLAGQFYELFNALRGTPLELGKHVEVAAWDENLWNSIVPFNINYIGVEQPLKQIADTAVCELMRMLDESPYRSGLIQVASQIVEISTNGQRKIL